MMAAGSKVDVYKVWLAIAGVIGIILIIAVGIYELNKPPLGTWRIGICRTFAELYVRYPYTVRIEEAVEEPYFAELSLNYLNAHGSRPTQIFRCDFEQAADGTIRIKEMRIDREKLAQDVVDRFNISLPYLIEDPALNRKLPDPFDGTFEGLKK